MRQFLILLSPFAPFISEELFEFFNSNSFVAEQKWPEHQGEWLKADKVDLVVQINGKLRAKVTLPIDQDEEVVFQLAKSEKNVVKHLGDKTIIKKIYVPNKLINLVVKK